jgi:hypothetical protein
MLAWQIMSISLAFALLVTLLRVRRDEALWGRIEKHLMLQDEAQITLRKSEYIDCGVDAQVSGLRGNNLEVRIHADWCAREAVRGALKGGEAE